MYCPQCGKEENGQTRFCRSCGQNLDTVARSLAGNEPSISTGGAIVQSPIFYALLLIVLGVLGATLFGPTWLDVKFAAGISGLVAMLGIGLLGFKGVMLMMAPP